VPRELGAGFVRPRPGFDLGSFSAPLFLRLEFSLAPAIFFALTFPWSVQEGTARFLSWSGGSILAHCPLRWIGYPVLLKGPTCLIFSVVDSQPFVSPNLVRVVVSESGLVLELSVPRLEYF
jgi:hypothetical protein